MITPDVSTGHIADYVSEAYHRASFLQIFALVMAERPECSTYPENEEWMGFYYVTGDLTRLLRAINDRASKEA
jgi:hypothetical protein